MVRERLLAALPFVEWIGVWWVNFSLFLLYASFFWFGVVTILLIVANANISWPLSLALACVLSISLTHGLIIAGGALLVPNYVFYPTKPRYLYMGADAVIFLSFVAGLTSYIVSSTSSSGPMFAVFFLCIATAIHTYKLYGLLWPLGILVPPLFGGQDTLNAKPERADVLINSSLSFDLSRAKGVRA